MFNKNRWFSMRYVIRDYEKENGRHGRKIKTYAYSSHDMLFGIG